MNSAPKNPPSRPRFAKCDPEWLTLELKGRDLRVLLALSLHADWSPKGFGRCFPRRDTLALTTRLQVSHVSEAVRELSQVHRLITVVRLGRKNVYYVRPIGETAPMPPSDPGPFFEYLGRLGIRLLPLEAGSRKVGYAEQSRRLDELPGLLLAIFSDYVHGLTTPKLEEALRINYAAPMGIPA